MSKIRQKPKYAVADFGFFTLLHACFEHKRHATLFADHFR